MATPLPNHPQLRGNYAPIQFEAECTDLIVEGDLPADLEGSLYRVGPNPKFVPDQGYHWFFGAGMVHAFHFGVGALITSTDGHAPRSLRPNRSRVSRCP
jgi:carotenoid cleavage dioxygenase-like enzyme